MRPRLTDLAFIADPITRLAVFKRLNQLLDSGRARAYTPHLQRSWNIWLDDGRQRLTLQEWAVALLLREAL